MTKKQVVWLLIRVAGLYFFWQSLTLTVSVSGAYALAGEEPELLAKASKAFLQAVVLAVLYRVLSLYCLGSGDAFFYLLNREPEDGESQ